MNHDTFSNKFEPYIWYAPEFDILVGKCHKKGDEQIANPNNCKYVHIVIGTEKYNLSTPLTNDMVQIDMQVEQALNAWKAKKCCFDLLAYTIVPNELNLLIKVHPIPDKTDCLCDDLKREIGNHFPMGKVLLCWDLRI